MSIDYVSREAWRGRGRPRKPADPDVVKRLAATYETGKVARLTLDEGTTEEDVRRTIAELRRAARHLGLALKLQPRGARSIVEQGEMRFYAEEEE